MDATAAETKADGTVVTTATEEKPPNGRKITVTETRPDGWVVETSKDMVRQGNRVSTTTTERRTYRGQSSASTSRQIEEGPGVPKKYGFEG